MNEDKINIKQGYDRRTSERIMIQCETKLFLIEDEKAMLEKIALTKKINRQIKEVVYGQILNVSADALLVQNESDKKLGGILVKTNQHLDTNSELILTFALPFSLLKEDFTAKAKVIHSIQKETHYEVGLLFMNVLMHYSKADNINDIDYLLNK